MLIVRILLNNIDNKLLWYLGIKLNLIVFNVIEFVIIIFKIVFLFKLVFWIK